MNVFIISGSPRKNSNSKKLSLALQRLSENAGLTASLIDFSEYDLPLMVHGKVDINNLSPFQNRLYQSMSSADLIYIVSPEYNWMPSAELVNFLHQMGDKPFAAMWKDKLFAIAGSSNGRGGRFPCVQLTYVINKICGFMGFESVVSPRSFESQFTQNSLDENGHSLGNEEYDKGLDLFFNFALGLAKKLNS